MKTTAVEEQSIDDSAESDKMIEEHILTTLEHIDRIENSLIADLNGELGIGANGEEIPSQIKNEKSKRSHTVD